MSPVVDEEHSFQVPRISFEAEFGTESFTFPLRTDNHQHRDMTVLWSALKPDLAGIHS
jgi:hypothetical protein